MKDIIEYLENKNVQSESEITNIDFKTIIGRKQIITPNHVTVKHVVSDGNVEGYNLSFMCGGEQVNLTEYKSEKQFKEYVFKLFKRV